MIFFKAAILFIFPAGRASILPFQVKFRSDKNAETKNENRRSNFVFKNLTKTKENKNGNTY